MDKEEGPVSRRNLMGVGAASVAGLAALLPASQSEAATVEAQRTAALDDMLAQQAIREVLYTYPRGLDKLDLDLLLSIGWPDAPVQMFDQKYNNWSEFMHWLHSVHVAMLFNNHRMTNMLIKVKGDKAVSETSATATLLRKAPDGQIAESWQHTRYLDQWERRKGVWKISHRRTLNDFRRASVLISEADFKARYQIADRAGTNDPSYPHFASI